MPEVPMLCATTDQMGRKVVLRHFPPQRIVSLVPSQTELLADLGLSETVVGITKFCEHPVDWFRSKTRVGGTKTLQMDRIESLNPDLILGNKEENDRSQVEALSARFPVWMSDVANLEDALDMVERVGILCGQAHSAQALAQRIVRGFEALPSFSPLRAAYLIWRKPYMVAGSGTFIDSMLQRAGLVNVFSDRPRYPEVSAEALRQSEPDVVLLSSEPYPFSEKHRAALLALCPSARVLLADGALFSWYGSRLLHTPGYLFGLRREMA